MNIDRLNLIGFGKFNNKDIEFSDNINIVYGDNEAGKTTIHSFIDGMFYGFLRPYVTRAYYTEEHDRFNPWYGNKYQGIIYFNDLGKDYRIERNFKKGDEYTKVFLEDTGEDITKDIDTGNSGRILQPGYEFFGFNDVVYNNTVSIGQLATITDELLAKEVRDKLANLSTSLDEDISVEDSISSLNDKIKEIGSIRARTSEYGKLSIRKDELKKDREKVLEEKRIYEDSIIKMDEVNKILKTKEEELDRLNNIYEEVKIREDRKKLEEAKDIGKEIIEIREKIEELYRYKNISLDDYSALVDLKSDIKHLDLRIKETETNILNTKRELMGIDRYSEDSIGPKIKTDYMRYEEINEEKNKLLLDTEASNIEFLYREYNENKEKRKLYISAFSISIIITIFFLITAITTKKYIQLLVGIITIPIILYSISNLRKVDGLLKRIENHGDLAKDKERERLLKIKELEDIERDILKRYNVDSKLELKRLNDKIQINILKRNETEKEYKRYDNMKEEYKGVYANLKVDKNRKISNMNKILLENNFNDLEEFKEGLDKKKELEKLSNDLDHKKSLLDKIIGDNELDELEDRINKYDKISKDKLEIENKTSENIVDNIEFKKNEISDIKVKIASIEERINNLNRYAKRLLDIEEELFRIDFKLKEFDKEIESLELAKSVILSLSKDIHQDFAPRINELVGNMMEKITHGKYTDIRVNDELDINVVNPETEEMIDIESLSGGTIDQLYFALRFGIIKSSEKKKLPLILDDCFIQYDRKRLENMMKYLVEESKDRQIILFTCQDREKEILDKLNTEYNLINI